MIADVEPRSKSAPLGLCVLLVGTLSSCLSIGWTKGYEPDGPVTLYTGPLPPNSSATPMVSLPAGVILIMQASQRQIHPTPAEQIALDGAIRIACIEDWTESPRQVHAADAVVVGSARTQLYPGFSMSLVSEGPREQTRIPVVAEFELRLPALRVNGELVSPEPIRFRASEKFGASFPVD